MAPTARPESPDALRRGGVHAHRRFEFDPQHLEEIIELSAAAWPTFESAYDAHIEGLFRPTATPGQLVLITWYASFAEWERSRGVGAAGGGAAGEARARFARRHQLTRRQIVRMASPVPPLPRRPFL